MIARLMINFETAWKKDEVEQKRFTNCLSKKLL